MSIKICTIDGCERKHYAKGLCDTHYRMEREHGWTRPIIPRHGHASRDNVSREYTSYRNMLSRCYNKRNPFYKNYGGRGISVCEAWRHSFLAFYADMGACPEGLTIDRKDNDGDYTPNNCHWASRTEQARNQRSCRMNIIAVRVIRLLLKNTVISQKRIATAYGVNQTTISRIYLNKTWRENSE